MEDKRFSSGFTLIEILVSIAITGIILTSLYSSFFMSRKAIEGLDDGPVRFQESRMALDIMKREVESAFYNRERPYTIFRIEGREIYGRDAASLIFTGFSHLMPGPRLISYRIEQSRYRRNGKEQEGIKDDRLSLVKDIASILPRPGMAGSDVHSVEILDDIESFTVEARYGDEWVKTWDSKLTQESPEEVRFTIVINIKGRRYTFSDVAKIRTGRSL